MQRFILVLSVLSFAAFSTGCGKDPAVIISEIEELKDQACKCSDAACGEKAMQDFSEYFQANKGKADGATPEQEKKIESLGTEFGMCLVKAGVSPQKLQALADSM